MIMNQPATRLLLFSSLLCLAGCNAGSAASGGPKIFRLAIIPKGTSHEFWYSVHAGARQADDAFDDVEITWKGPATEGDTAEQIKMVENFLIDGYSGICLAPLDAIALRRPVDEAIAAKVPVLIFDSALADAAGTISYVATNNYRGGQRAGEYLAKLLDGRGKVLLMRYAINSESTQQREQGFLDALAAFPEITFLEKDKHAGPTETDAIKLAENLLSNYGSQVEGIFCPNQSTTSGMLNALRRAGLAGKVKFVGFDAGQTIAKAIEAGELDATVLQDPVKMGYESVRVMRAFLRGEKPPQRIEVPEHLATTENCRQPEIRALLYPPLIE
jgi:ribose transport system substrate-binding protein